MKTQRIKRILEIVPGFISWSIIIFFITLAVFKPLMLAILLIVYLVFWTTRLLYMITLLILAHHRMLSKKNVDWLQLCKNTCSDKKLEDVLHIVLYTIYKEPQEVLHNSLSVLKNANYPGDKIIVVLAGEERESGSKILLENMKQKFLGYFKDIIVTIHPKDIEGELACKGANATYAAKLAKEYLGKMGNNLENVVISCFDVDTCPDKNYFSCLSYHFITNPKRYQTSFQPLPVYSNNIYAVPAFARVIEMGSMFWQLNESMRYGKFITFSSHSMSFKTLVAVNYWPVNLISDDSLIFWKCFLNFNGHYTTYSMEVPVHMDIAVGRNLIHTIAVQYRQKRRWAWGVETFVFLATNIFKNPRISFFQKTSKLFQILDNHVNWATWAVIISFVTPFLLFWGTTIQQNSLILYNLACIKNIVFNSLTIIVILCIFISKEFIPPKPKDVPRTIYVYLALQWFLVPFVSACLGSLPALDAQTRLMLKKPLGFYPTPKRRTYTAHGDRD